MTWWRCAILMVLIIPLVTLPAFAQSSTYGVKDPTSGQSYVVNYSITNATVSDMSIDTQGTSLVISINSTDDGSMTITLPRTLIDAKTGAADEQFIILEDGAEIDFQETKTSNDRTVSMPFPDGTESIEIIGTQVVPEFPSSLAIILAVAVISIVILSRTRLRILQI